MPRRARLRVAKRPIHLIQRGNNRSACFGTSADRSLYLHLLSEQADKYDCAVHAYVLMTNHVHLLVTPASADGASHLMKHLGQRYVQYINRSYGRTGTLWEGRFKSSIVQEQWHLLRCYRYIELNPVRANMVRHPGDYNWSSYRSNTGREPSMLVKPHPEYLALGATDEQRHDAYRALFGSALEANWLSDIREATSAGYVLGTEGFKAEMAAALLRRVDRGRSGRPRKKRIADSNEQDLF
jgi:putative transposase